MIYNTASPLAHQLTDLNTDVRPEIWPCSPSSYLLLGASRNNLRQRIPPPQPPPAPPRASDSCLHDYFPCCYTVLASPINQSQCGSIFGGDIFSQTKVRYEGDPSLPTMHERKNNKNIIWVYYRNTRERSLGGSGRSLGRTERSLERSGRSLGGSGWSLGGSGRSLGGVGGV